jgi:alpha-tubulin suppressor-like RCC1 family protein
MKIGAMTSGHSKSRWFGSLAVLIAIVLANGPSVSWAQGEIVGWGIQVVLGEASLSGLTALAAGTLHSLGLRNDGTIVAWGENGWRQCDVPAPNADFVAVAAGGFHNLGLKSNGTIAAWGRGDFGQCYVPTPNTNFMAVAAGGDHSLGLKADSTIVAWGRCWPTQSSSSVGGMSCGAITIPSSSHSMLGPDRIYSHPSRKGISYNGHPTDIQHH